MAKATSAIFLLLAIGIAPCAAEDYAKAQTETLIDDLTTLGATVPGIDGRGIYEGFLAGDAPPAFVGGMLPPVAPSNPPMMREIVRRGVAALPALLAHLDDKRPTRLMVGELFGDGEVSGIGGQFFDVEYDPRDRNQKPPPGCGLQCPAFDHKYTIKVGDVCEVLVGQIVNRRLYAARYQASAIVVVNSPVETPALAQLIRRDWNGLDAPAHEASLLADLRAEDDLFAYGGALVRLRFYYPKTYAALGGRDLEKRNAFEAQEQKDTVGTEKARGK